MNDYNQRKQRVKNQINAENVEQDIENLGKLNQEINAKKVRIGSKPITCPNCKTSNKSTNKFCKACGTSLTKLCKTCRTENELSAIYCISCGAEIEKSKFSIPPQYAQAWKEKFMSQGWHISPINEWTLQKLEKIGQPSDKNENIILCVGVSGTSVIHKLKAAGREVLPNINPTHEKMVMGSVFFTNQRVIVKSDPDGWVVAYPHEYLEDVTTSQGSAFVNFKKVDSVAIKLHYKGLGTIEIHRKMPSLIEPRGMFARMTSSDLHNAQMDMQTSVINASLGGVLREAHGENSTFVSFFEYIIDLQKDYHLNQPISVEQISREKFIYIPPETSSQQTTNTTKTDSSCAPIVLVLFLVGVVGVAGFICFGVLLTL
jgi:hypothetical protein